MKIVKPTKPPTMAVIVDTVIHDEVELAVFPSHPVKARIDTVWSSKGSVGIANGVPAISPIAPTLKSGQRPIAKIRIHPSVSHIYEENIQEI